MRTPITAKILFSETYIVLRVNKVIIRLSFVFDTIYYFDAHLPEKKNHIEKLFFLTIS
jgi:hypothetical protein